MSDEHFFEQAMQEVSDRKVVRALWARALAEADGDKVKTIARYVRMRVEQLKADGQSSPTLPTPDAPSASTEPPATPVESPAQKGFSHYPKKASAWRRFFARTIDLLLESAAVGGVFVYFAANDPAFNEWVQRMGPTALGMMILPLALVLDALLLGLLINYTPGKALLGVKVLDQNGYWLTVGPYLARNLRLWFSGLALGLPLFNLFTMAYQGEKVSKEGYATYDRDTKTQVVAEPLGLVQGAAAAFVLIVLVSVTAVLSSAFA